MLGIAGFGGVATYIRLKGGSAMKFRVSSVAPVVAACTMLTSLSLFAPGAQAAPPPGRGPMTHIMIKGILSTNTPEPTDSTIDLTAKATGSGAGISGDGSATISVTLQSGVTETAKIKFLLGGSSIGGGVVLDGTVTATDNPGWVPVGQLVHIIAEEATSYIECAIQLVFSVTGTGTVQIKP